MCKLELKRETFRSIGISTRIGMWYTEAKWYFVTIHIEHFSRDVTEHKCKKSDWIEILHQLGITGQKVKWD